MKFRVERDTVKFRLTLDEIESLKNNQILTNDIALSPNNKFEYSIKTSKTEQHLSLNFNNGSVEAEVPVDLLNAWFGSDSIGLKEVLINDKGENLQVVIEKDLPRRKLKKL